MTTIPRPTAPFIHWAPSTLIERGVVVLLHEGTADTIDWGDGTSSPYVGGAQYHTYNRANAYVVTVKSGDMVVANEAVHVRDGLTPDVVIDDGEPNVVSVYVSGLPIEVVHTLTIDWGDGSAPQRDNWRSGQVIRHNYRAGSYVLSISDDVTRRSGQYEVMVTDRVGDPDFCITKDVTAPSITLTITNLVTPTKDLLVDWGDFTRAVIPAAQAGSAISHTYSGNGKFIVQLVYADGSTIGCAQLVEISSSDNDA